MGPASFTVTFTVVMVTGNAAEAGQPLLPVILYCMLAVPAEMPVTVPVPETVAMAASLLLHTPPGVALLSCTVLPAHIWLVPVMLLMAGDWITVTVLVFELEHPFELYTVYLIVPVPADTPVNNPPLVTVATFVLVLDHAPAPGMPNSVIVVPEQIVSFPLMAGAEGDGFTVITRVT